MRFRRIFYIIPIGLLLIGAGFFGMIEEDPDLRIAVASSVRFVAGDLIHEMEEEKGWRIEMVTASSGKLTDQIQRGAPYDLFLAANTKYPQALHSRGRTLGKPVVYAEGVPVLWSVKEDLPLSREGVTILGSKDIKRIAIADPDVAPFGRLAMKVLKEEGMMEVSRDAFVYGTSVSQVDQFILSGNADVGITSRAVVQSSRMKGKGQWVRLGKSTLPQSAVLLKNREKDGSEAKSRAFLRHILSPDGQKTLRANGYNTFTGS